MAEWTGERQMSRTVLGILKAGGQPDEPCVLKRACEKAQVTFQCESVSSADEAVRYLSGAGPYGDRSRHPTAGARVMLDLDLEGNGSYRMLSWIGSEPRIL